MRIQENNIVSITNIMIETYHVRVGYYDYFERIIKNNISGFQ